MRSEKTPVALPSSTLALVQSRKSMFQHRSPCRRP
jgi:hypothetical protein